MTELNSLAPSGCHLAFLLLTSYIAIKEYNNDTKQRTEYKTKNKESNNNSVTQENCNNWEEICCAARVKWSRSLGFQIVWEKKTEKRWRLDSNCSLAKKAPQKLILSSFKRISYFTFEEFLWKECQLLHLRRRKATVQLTKHYLNVIMLSKWCRPKQNLTI